jgi:hypothetical protein
LREVSKIEPELTDLLDDPAASSPGKGAEQQGFAASILKALDDDD